MAVEDRVGLHGRSTAGLSRMTLIHSRTCRYFEQSTCCQIPAGNGNGVRRLDLPGKDLNNCAIQRSQLNIFLLSSVTKFHFTDLVHMPFIITMIN